MAQSLARDVPPDFSDTSIGFSHLKESELHKAYYLFKLMNKPTLVKAGGQVLLSLMRLRFPIQSIVRHTMFGHFCGGETMGEAIKTAQRLADKNVGAVFDYAVEGVEGVENFSKNALKIKKSIEFAATYPELIPFCVIKITGLARFSILEKLSETIPLTPIEALEWEESVRLINEIFGLCHSKRVRLLVDAEESWITPAIDQLVEEAMQRFNRKEPIIFHTLQFYRHDRLSYFKYLFNQSEQKEYYLGVKIVRGAYLEKENKRAEEKGYKSPLYSEKKQTDSAFDQALDFGFDHIEKISLFIGTHNESSTRSAVEILETKNLARDHPHVIFSQLYGMSDVITFNLAYHGYNTCKYVPFGPIQETVPYLLRRAEENSSVLGQTSRELDLIIKEMEKRELIA